MKATLSELIDTLGPLELVHFKAHKNHKSYEDYTLVQLRVMYRSRTRIYKYKNGWLWPLGG